MNGIRSTSHAFFDLSFFLLIIPEQMHFVQLIEMILRLILIHNRKFDCESHLHNLINTFIEELVNLFALYLLLFFELADLIITFRCLLIIKQRNYFMLAKTFKHSQLFLDNSFHTYFFHWPY